MFGLERLLHRGRRSQLPQRFEDEDLDDVELPGEGGTEETREINEKRVIPGRFRDAKLEIKGQYTHVTRKRIEDITPAEDPKAPKPKLKKGEEPPQRPRRYRSTDFDEKRWGDRGSMHNRAEVNDGKGINTFRARVIPEDESAGITATTAEGSPGFNVRRMMAEFMGRLVIRSSSVKETGGNFPPTENSESLYSLSPAARGGTVFKAEAQEFAARDAKVSFTGPFGVDLQIGVGTQDPDIEENRTRR